uniref:Uncharacterized protein n=1 Tax=Tetradesmus obliquus TaxID=3088 RepID=A0A383W2G6_TETOB|eukprot:jgi/Sobl393_1/16627/SZX70846.1
MGLLLHLGSLENEFYASPGCLRVYTRWDALGLLYAVFLNTALLRMIRQHLLNPDMWHFTVQFAIYGVTAAAQLLLLWRHPQRHQRHRMGIIAAHRLLRLVLTGLSAAASNQQQSNAVQSTLTSSSGGTFLVTGYPWLKLLRSVVLVPLVAMAPSNFVLPVRYAIPCQLLTLVFILRMCRLQHCTLAQLPELHDLLQQACSAFGTAVHWGSLLLWRGSATSALAAGEVGRESAPMQQVCGSSVGASLVLSMYANVLLVVLVPSFLQYGIERSLKRSFLEQKQGPSARQQQGSAAAAATPATAQDAKFKTESKQPLMTLLCTVLLIMTSCLASWHACIAAAAHMQHTCG